MNKIKSIILDQTNWLEVTWVKVETITLPQEVVDGVADMVLRTQEVETILHCESFGDSDEYQELLRQRLAELSVETTQELESILDEQASKRYIPTEEELEAKRLADEEQRIQSIKLTTKSLILQKYPLEKQSSANLGLYGEEYLAEMKAYISNIIMISTEAEISGTKVEDIQWQ